MTSVNVTQSAGAPYTWETATFTFEDVEAGKSFDESFPAMYFVDANEEFVFSELLRKNIVKPRFESVAFASIARNQYSLRKQESFGISSLYSRNVSFIRNFARSLLVAEELNRIFAMRKFESISALESAQKKVSKLLQEDFSTSENYLGSVAFMRNFIQAFGVSEASLRNFSKRNSELLNVAETSKKSFSKSAFEAFAAIDDITKNFTGRNFESISALESASRSVSKMHSESFSISEASRRDFSKVSFENFFFAEQASKSSTMRSFESFAVLESSSRNLLKRSSEAFSTSESLKRNFSKVPLENVSFGENLAKDLTRFTFEQIGTASAYQNKFAKRRSEGFSVAENSRRSFVKDSPQSLSVSEELVKSLVKRYSERVDVDELASKASLKALNDSFRILDKSHKVFSKNSIRSLSISESLNRTAKFRREVLESVLIQEIASKRTSKALKDELLVVDNSEIQFLKTLQESIFATEDAERTVAYYKAFFETFSAFDNERKSVSIQKHEAISLIEEWRRKAGAIISAVVIESEAIDLAGFRNYFDLGVIPGYAPFKPFIPGDYSYKDALFKIVMQSNTNDRARVDELRVDIDVPDVIDRGTATITNATAGVTVSFAREFLEEPEITVTLRGASTVGIPRVTSKDKTQFTLHLLNNSGGFTTGTVSWVAQGY